MALLLADRIKETSITTGAGAFTLAGAVTGFKAFSVIGDANTTYYAIVHRTANEWEVGLGTYTAAGTLLARTAVLASTNGGAAVNFSAGTKDVFVTAPADILQRLILIGATPGGELGGTWASPTVDAIHSGSSHASIQAAAEATAAAALSAHVAASDPHPTYLRQSEADALYAPISVVGTVTGNGTSGKIPKWSSSSALTDSILSESGTVVSAAGSLAAAGFNTLTMAPSITGNPVTLTATGGDADVSLYITAKAAGIIGIGDTINSDALSFGQIQIGQSFTGPISGGYQVGVGRKAAVTFAIGDTDAEFHGQNDQDVFNVAQNTGFVYSHSWFPIWNISSGKTLQAGYALDPFPHFFGPGTLSAGWGATFGFSAADSLTATKAGHIELRPPEPTGGSAITDWFYLWGGNLVGTATNPYFLWYDGTGTGAGVWRVNHLGVMAYYNPAFTAYTPGATNFERIVQQWNTNVAEIGVEVGGTGTNRNLRLIGAGYKLAALTANGFVKTSGGDGTLSVDATAYLASIAADAPLSGGGTSASHLTIQQADATHNGYLSSTDWSTFNNKQPAGSYLTAATGVTSINKTGSAALVGAVTLTGGSNVTLTQSGQDISIAAAGSSGTVTSVGLVGTANQVVVTGASPITSSGSWTLSTPQDIATSSSPTFAGVTLGTSGILVGGTNLIEQRNGANAQTLSIYGTFTNASNYERLSISASTSEILIENNQAGTGVARNLRMRSAGILNLSSGGSSSMVFQIAGVGKWQIINAGGFESVTDNANDIGQAASNRPRTGYFGTSVISPVFTATGLITGGSFKSAAPAGGTSGTWKLGVAASVSPTAPNRTIELDIGGTIYYLAGKTTND